MMTLLCCNAEVIFELMTDRVRDIKEHSSSEFLEKYKGRFQVDLERGSEQKYSKYFAKFLAMKGAEAVKFRYFDPQVLVDIVQILKMMIQRAETHMRLDAGPIIHMLRNLTNTDISEVSHDDTHLGALFSTFESLCDVVGVCSQRMHGFWLKTYSEYFSKVIGFKLFHKMGFLTKLVSLLTTLSNELPMAMHMEMLYGETDFAFLLSKLIIWNQKDRDMLETNHAKMKKVKKVMIFDKRTMPWTEKLLQEEPCEALILLRFQLLRCTYTCITNRL